MKVTTILISPIQHWGDGKAVCRKVLHIIPI